MKSQLLPPEYAAGLLYPICELIRFSSLVVKPSRHRWTLFIPILLCWAIVIRFCSSSNIALMDNYTMGCTMTIMLFTASEQILLCDVQNELCAKGQQGVISQATFQARFCWGLHLFLSPRGVGWTHEPTSRLPLHRKGITRWGFVFSRLLCTAYTVLLSDMCNIYMLYSPSYAAEGPSLTSLGWWGRLTAVPFCLVIYARLMGGYSLMSAIFVALGFWGPDEWPPLFDSYLDAYTLQKLWGQVWHQLLRRFVIVHGRFVSQTVLRISRGTTMNALVQLYTAFFITGIIHGCGDYMVFRKWTGGSFHFFFMQAIGITIEYVVIALAERAGYTRRTIWTKLIGYVWVINWIAYTVVFSLDPLLRAGGGENTLPFSVILGLWRGEWTPTRYRIQ